MMVWGGAAKINTATYESHVTRLDGTGTILWATYVPYIVGGILLVLAALMTVALAVQVFRERTWMTFWQVLVILDALSLIAALFLIIPGTPI